MNIWVCKALCKLIFSALRPQENVAGRNLGDPFRSLLYYKNDSE